MSGKRMDTDEARAALAEENPDALWPDGFEAAYIGQARRCGQPTLAAFSVTRCIEILMKRDGMTYEEADEFFEFNTAGAWVGEGTPVWIYDTVEDYSLDSEEVRLLEAARTSGKP